MSNVGRQFPSEITTFVDETSGRTIKQLTKSGYNVHFYFTENSYTLGDKEIIYKHTNEGEKIAELYAMDLETGVRTQLTDFAAWGIDNIGFVTKTNDSKYIVFIAGDKVYKLERGTENLTHLYTAPFGFKFFGGNVSFDNRYVAFALNEIVDYHRQFSGKNYDGFNERYYKQKRGKIVVIYMDGSGGETIVDDTCQVAHVQFAPDTNEFLTYCHEGPWNLVTQRIWMVNTVTRRVMPCFRQDAPDSVGHEFWTRDGLVFFDNRGPGHDGTITVDRKQAFAEESESAIPCIGFADKDCNIVRYLEVPFYCNHYHANIDNTKLVGDALDDLMLIDISTDTPKMEVLCKHGTSWETQSAHPHPTFSWSNNSILYASDKDEQGKPQLYLIEM